MYKVRVEDCARRVRVIFDGVPVADSARAKMLSEGTLAPVYYFPRSDVRMDLLHATSHRTYCPFRGNASYWTVSVKKRSADNAAWSYEDPYEESKQIKRYIAFYRERMDAIVEEGAASAALPVSPQPAANRLLAWLLNEAHAAPSARDLVEAFGAAMQGARIPVARISLGLRTLHPQLAGMSFIWEDNGKGVEQVLHSRESLSEQRYLASPVRTILEGAGGLRRRLDLPDPVLDYPILHDLRAQGCTDYVAMPFVFSSGQINVLSLATRHPGGFSTEDLGQVHEVIPVLTRIVEVHVMRTTAVQLLDVYLGKQSGAKVLDGRVKRGDGEEVNAVIWFSDLRGSTGLADAMPRREFLSLLDDFFDCTAGAVLQHGGEVLRFIGDASLAIFPISETLDGVGEVTPQAVRACETALAAALDAHSRLRARNQRRSGDGPALEAGVGLHVGDVLYGNIGTPERLEVSVIGAAANEAARIAAMCKPLGASPLVSGAFARHLPARLRPLGRHSLRGVGAEQELYTLS